MCKDTKDSKLLTATRRQQKVLDFIRNVLKVYYEVLNRKVTPCFDQFITLG